MCFYALCIFITEFGHFRLQELRKTSLFTIFALSTHMAKTVNNNSTFL
jgi:hypothetical protein